MGYQESTETVRCKACGSRVLVTVKWAGYGPANEWERENCPNCGNRIASEQCLGIEVKLITQEEGAD